MLCWVQAISDVVLRHLLTVTADTECHVKCHVKVHTEAAVLLSDWHVAAALATLQRGVLQ